MSASTIVCWVPKKAYKCLQRNALPFFVGLRGSSYFITHVATSTGIYSTAIRESVNSLCRDTDGWIAYCVSVVVFYPLSTPPPLERPVRFRYGNLQNRDFVIIIFFFKRPTARLVDPETMTQSPNCFGLPCAVTFHKINARYEVTTTTANCSCLIYGY